MFKKSLIMLILLFICNSAFASCSITGGACKIDDIVVKNKKDAIVKIDKNNMKQVKEKQNQVKKPLFKVNPQQKKR